MKIVRCQKYKTCRYRDECSHSVDHYINTSNKPPANNCILDNKVAILDIKGDKVECYCSEKFSEISHRKEKIIKLNENR